MQEFAKQNVLEAAHDAAENCVKQWIVDGLAAEHQAATYGPRRVFLVYPEDVVVSHYEAYYSCYNGIVNSENPWRVGPVAAFKILIPKKGEPQIFRANVQSIYQLDGPNGAQWDCDESFECESQEELLKKLYRVVADYELERREIEAARA